MPENCNRSNDKNKICMALKLLIFLLALDAGNGYFIQIDHDEFRASGYPRPALPPPLPPIDHLPHQHILLPSKELTPSEFMVDLSNDLTYRLLHYHSILNRNNFAFSPTALMSVLVALYEGSAGRSAMELRNVLQLPNNRDIIRVGYRDIHRRLRTYFFESENPLKGLSLNKDNVTITRDYETILMFYGYDLGMDMVSSSTQTPSTTPIENLTPANMTTMATTMSSILTTTTAMPATTITTTDKTESEPNTESTEKSTKEPTMTTTTATTQITTEKDSIATTEAPTTTTTIAETTTEASEDATETTAVVAESTTPAPPNETTEKLSTENGNEAAELVSSIAKVDSDAEPLLRIQKARISRLPSSKLQAPPNPITPKTNYLPSARGGATLNRFNRNKRHLFGLKDLDANLFVTLFSPPQTVHQEFIPASGFESNPSVSKDYDVEIDPNYLGVTEAKQNYNTDVISHVFYLGNQQVVHTTFKVYNAVLYHKYFENLNMNVLELELDTPEYNLMIFLPDFHTDLVTAAASLRLGPTLRLLRKQLKPRWVQAIIPDFKLQGSMFLTNDLQNLGICDVFEPSRADFRPMTDEKGIYVKHIEQLINVNIRTRPINQLKRNYGQQTQPIQISVNHPFMFFIVDRDLDVAVMAGRVLNPLNVRIQ